MRAFLLRDKKNPATVWRPRAEFEFSLAELLDELYLVVIGVVPGRSIDCLPDLLGRKLSIRELAYMLQ